MNKNYYLRNTSSGDIVSFSSASGFNYSLTDLKNIINSYILNPHFRISILNSDETVNSVISLDAVIKGGSYEENYQNGQRRSLSLTLFNGMGEFTPSINGLWGNKKINFEIGIEINNDILWFSKGIYCINNINPSHEVGNKNVDLELGDKFSLFESNAGVLPYALTIEPGELIEEVIQNILLQDMGNGEVFDPKPFIYHSSFKGKTIQATISKNAGDTYADVLLDLATQLSAEVFYDQLGQLNFLPTSELSQDADKPVIASLFADKGDIFDLNLDFDLSEIVNCVYVIGNNINGGYCQAMAVNDNPGSPLSIQILGYRTAEPIEDSNITTETLAQERADYELRQQLILKSSASLSTRINPTLLVNNLINITDEYFNLSEEKFIIQGLSFNLDFSGTMDLTLANIRNLPFLVQ